jgi:hypothetical protein
MANLIVTRPRLGPLWDLEERFDVLIDGNPDAPIDLGETIVIELPPGPHLVSTRFASAGSQPIRVEAAPGEPRRLAVGAAACRSFDPQRVCCGAGGRIPRDQRRAGRLPRQNEKEV